MSATSAAKFAAPGRPRPDRDPRRRSATGSAPAWAAALDPSGSRRSSSATGRRSACAPSCSRPCCSPPPCPASARVFLRVYENTLVRQTEAELIAQGAVLAQRLSRLLGAPAGRAAAPPRRSSPSAPTIDLSAHAGPAGSSRPAPPAGAARSRAPLAVAATLAADRRPTAPAPRSPRSASSTAAAASLIGRDDVGGELCRPARGPRRARRPDRAPCCARRGDYQPRYWLEWLSRASAIRVHHARPIVAGGEVVGVLHAVALARAACSSASTRTAARSRSASA